MEKNYNIRIDGIDIIRKSLRQFQATENDIFNHNISTQCVGDETRNLLVVFIQVKISKVNNPDDVFGEIMASIGFFIENYKEAFDKNDKGQYIIPDSLETLLKSMSISTMRGIMFSEFRGTQLHRAVLPVILMDSLKPIDGSLVDELHNSLKVTVEDKQNESASK